MENINTPINGKLKDWWRSNVKEWKPITQKIKTVVGTGPRVAFLGLIRINLLGMATLLNLKNNPKIPSNKKSLAILKYNAVANKFYSWGGNRTTFQKTVIKGAKEKAIGSNLPILKNLDFVKKLKKLNAISGHNNTGLGDLATATAAVAAAAPLIVSIAGLLGTLATIAASAGAFDKGKDNSPYVEDETTYDNNYDTEDGINIMGGSIVGVAILAALFIGTKKGNKK